jgi:hypothetical protein
MRRAEKRREEGARARERERERERSESEWERGRESVKKGEVIDGSHACTPMQPSSESCELRACMTCVASSEWGGSCR